MKPAPKGTSKWKLCPGEMTITVDFIADPRDGEAKIIRRRIAVTEAMLEYSVMTPKEMARMVFDTAFDDIWNRRAETRRKGAKP